MGFRNFLYKVFGAVDCPYGEFGNSAGPIDGVLAAGVKEKTVSRKVAEELLATCKAQEKNEKVFQGGVEGRKNYRLSENTSKTVEVKKGSKTPRKQIKNDREERS